MTQEEFRDEFRELMCKAMDSNIDPSWVMGEAAFRVFWTGMIQRCTNPRHKAFKNYGGRGIRVCPEWLNSFDAFLRDMGPRQEGYELDRKNNNGNYEASNCLWVTHKQNNRNKRTNRYVEAFGKRLCISEWSETTGIPHYLITERLNRGWSSERAVSP